MAIRVKNPPVALIAGPTASGKSALALALAERTGGVIVNADSAQVYSDLPILSAAPTAEELGRAEHRLYGVRDATAPCSAADWAESARSEIADIHASGRISILAGGTGLYIRTLLDGIAPVPRIDPEIRQSVRDATIENNRERLAVLDPKSAERLEPADKARIGRALEIILSTGRTIGEWQDDRVGGIAEAIDLRPLILIPPRDWLYARCNERFARMVELGAVKEVEALQARELNPALPIMRAIGVRELSDYLRGKAALAEAVAAGQQATRRYAKRQYTWFAHQPPPIWPRFREPLNIKVALELLDTSA